ncbi:NosD domain-containing protein [Haladaptatus halobius]|uniref:NosD domain-containing protein n=1 Tax=Haladaptatus halobius TaxID=2884875 RepID=UPI0034A3607C
MRTHNEYHKRWGTGISQSCIEIRSGNVILDGNGHTIDGRGNSHTTAIQVNTSNNSSNIQITNAVITDWYKGIVFQHSEPGKIQNISASSNVYGISIEDSHLVMTKNNRLQNNLVGMKVSDNSIHIELWGNSFSENQVKKL